jgi:predicted protein tyrosine phosphatase
MVNDLVEARGIGRVLGLLAGANEHPTLPDLAATGNHLKLTMHDIAAPVDGMKPPGTDQVEQLIRFVESWNRKAPMLIHCWAGISRSTASAFITQCLHRPNSTEKELADELRDLSPSATPNPLIIAHADALMGRNGRMISAIENIGRGANAFEGNVFEWQI